MSPLEAISTLLAPHTCLVCCREGAPLCNRCCDAELIPPLPRCYRCNEYSEWFRTCNVCRWHNDTVIDHVWVGAQYVGTGKELIGLLKFKRAKVVSRTIGLRMCQMLPPVPSDVVIAPVPTATRRIRARGYDQAALIAQAIARQRQVQYREVLFRRTNTRQVGSSRRDRQRHLEGVFVALRPSEIAHKRFLLIDDVLTTGATLEVAARVLKAHGALMVNAGVFAH